MQKLLFRQQNEQRATGLIEDLCMSLMYKIKRIGPSTEPCGTPNAMFDIEELKVWTETYCFLLLK